MGLDDIPLFLMLKGKLGYVNQRQRLISENIANADTPGYAPRDLKPFTFAAMVDKSARPVALARTDPAHIAAGSSRTNAGGAGDVYRAATTPDSETRLDGNQVVLEEEMSKMTEARIDYETALDFYQQSLNLITTAARAPGKSS